jgi:uncharacterized protein YqjF (DUF2071 family)
VTPRPFLTAQWRHLAMVNFEADPHVLEPLVPPGTELDVWNGQLFVSLVGFLFLDTRVLGIGIPGYQDFTEVNLRFYVRRRSGDEWRRAVVFVKEIVPHRAIALTARALYGERYVALPMDHRLQERDGRLCGVSYSWWLRDSENRIEVAVTGEPREPAEGSHEAFITEHYWGYARRRGGLTTEYRVAHPRWRVRLATEAKIVCDVAPLYGDAFVDCLQGPPVSAFLAEGSPVQVFSGRTLR